MGLSFSGGGEGEIDGQEKKKYWVQCPEPTASRKKELVKYFVFTRFTVGAYL